MITTLKEILTKDPIYPITSAEAVLKENGESISDSLIPEGGQKGQILQITEQGKEWKYPFKDMIDTFAYGVEWDTEVADPHLTRIGNMSLHKSLPIQSAIKGCIAQNGVIQYYLNEDDWRFKKEPEYTNAQIGWVAPVVGNATLPYIGEVSEGKVVGAFLRCDKFAEAPNKYKLQWIKINGVPCQLTNEINPTDGSVSFIADRDLGIEVNSETGLEVEIELGSCRNGYDGEVMVEFPEFFLRSYINGTNRKVYISTIQLDETWVRQEALLVQAYRATLLRSVPSDMGFLSTLPKTAVISVVNPNDYCRGWGNNAEYDKYMTGDNDTPINIYRTALNKPASNDTRITFRAGCKSMENSSLLNYDQYKNLFIWLWMIEYANRNSQEAFNSELTSEGYRQGGLGNGFTSYSYGMYLCGTYYPVIPQGTGDEYGNRTAELSVPITGFTYTTSSSTSMSSYSIAAGATKTSTSITFTKTTAGINMAQIQSFYCPLTVTYHVEGLNGVTMLFSTSYGTNVVGQISEDGDITVTWPTAIANREIRFSETKEGTNIVLTIVSAEAGDMEIPSQTCKVCRWRGFTNVFGDLSTMLEGTLVDIRQNEEGKFYLYTCSDPEHYGDTLTEYYQLRGAMPGIIGYKWLRSVDIGETAEFIPESIGGSITTYFCDYYHGSDSYTSALGVVRAGSYSVSGGAAGFSFFDCHFSFSNRNSYGGFRAVSHIKV